MPKYTYSFASPKYREETIVDANGKVVGTVRLKPVSIAWRPANARRFYMVSIRTFTEWMESCGAKRARQ